MLKPLRGKVIIRPLKQETISEGGLIIPENNKYKPQEGEVVALGGQIHISNIEVPFQVKIGDKVLFNRGAGTSIEDEGEKFLLMAENDIVAKF